MVYEELPQEANVVRPSELLIKRQFTVKKKAEREGKTSEGSELSNDFKIALAAVTSDEDYKSLEEQFLRKK